MATQAPISTVKIEERDDHEEATTDLIREAIGETRELIRIEVALAREEFRGELTAAKWGASAFGAAGAVLIAAFAVFMVAIALAFPVGWLAALIVGVVLLVIAGSLGMVGFLALPKRFFHKTKGRLETDIKELREHLG